MKAIFRLLVSLMLLHIQANGQDLMQEMVNAVSADSLMATITALQNFGTRYENTPQRDSAASYLLEEFTRLGLQMESDRYSFGRMTLYDIAAAGTGTLFMTGSQGVVLKSLDGGEQWTRIPTSTKQYLFAIAFADSQTGCIAGSYEFLRTVDGGNTWNSVPGVAGGWWYDVGFIDDSVGLVVGYQGAIFRTTDAGAHWDSIPSGATTDLNSIKILNPSNIWVAGENGAILHSINKGLTWIPSITGVSSSFSGIDFSTPFHGWAAGSLPNSDKPDFVSTTDGGTNWTRTALPPTADNGFVSVCFQDSLRGWIADYRGKVFHTTDAGRRWTLSYNHASGNWGPFIKCLSPLPASRITVCGEQGTILTTKDAGVTWESKTDGLPDSLLHRSRNIVATLPGAEDPTLECVLVAHYDSYSRSGPTVAPGANDNASGVSSVIEAARIARDYRFRNTIRFLAVSAEEQGMIGSGHYSRRARDKAQSIIGVVNGDMIGYPTTSDTARLVAATYLIPNRLTDSALVANQRYGIGLTLIVLLDSTGASDYGPFALMGYDALDIAEATAPEIWGGADPYYHSTLDLASNIRPDLVRRGAQLMLAVAGNLAHPAGKATDVQQQIPHLPGQFALEQNYPNPFNPTTRIRYTVGRVVVTSGALLSGVEGPASSKVSLVVYDVLGRELAVLVNERKAPGSYEVAFDGGRLASGMYIYRLTAGSFMQTRTMLLLK